MSLYSHWGPPLAVAGLGAIEGAANAGATPAHFLAAGSVVVGIAMVLKGWQWVRHEVGGQIGEAIAIHGAQDEVRHEQIKGEIRSLRDAIKGRPCIACDRGRE